MPQFIIFQILFIATGVVLVMIVRTLPRIREEEAGPVKKTILERWITSEIPDRLDETTNTILEKTYRKTKVFIMRIDNLLTDRLRKLKPEGNSDGKPKIDFGDITGERKKDENG